MEPKPHIEERELLLRLRDGDGLAFTALYEHYRKPLAAKLLRMLKSDELALDAMQELFAKVWEVRATLDVEQSFVGFLYKAATNQVLNSFRKIKRDEHMKAVVAMSSARFYAPIEDNLIGEERRRALHDALGQLPPRQREVLVLHKLEGKSGKEISELLNISVSAVNNHVYRAIQQLGEILSRNPIAILVALATWLLASCALA